MSNAARQKLEASSRGFRDRYLGWDDLRSQMDAWCEAFPELVRARTIGRTPEGRELVVLEVGRDPDRPRPAAWVDGNMHAAELAGSSVALAICEEVLRVHLGLPSGAAAARAEALPEHLAQLLREDVLFYVMPRMSPDGAERVLTTGQYVRSVPRDGRLGRTAPSWRQADLDGDGRIGAMRVRDPAGPFVEDPVVPGLLVPRRLEDPGPYFSVYPEGLIDNWDGVTIPRDEIHADTETDLNRNFPFSWAPEPRQKGAGPFAASEPESRAVVEEAIRRPNIFLWLNLHTFGGVYIRPAGDRPDPKLDQGDLAILKAIEGFTTPITGYPFVSGFEEFTYEPSVPLCGDLSTFAYAQRGAIGMVCELWDFFSQAGLPVLRPFVHNYQRRTRADAQRIAAWDRAVNDGRIVGTWRPFEHPQLGPVELGGGSPLVGIWNPPERELRAICDRQAAATLRMATLAPRLRVEASAERLGEGLSRVTALVRNEGYLPTTFLPSAAALPFVDAPRAELVLPAGATFEGGAAEAVRRLGHLAGWGMHEGASPIFLRSWGGHTAARASWVVRGGGEATLRISSSRCGVLEAAVRIG